MIAPRSEKNTLLGPLMMSLPPMRAALPETQASRGDCTRRRAPMRASLRRHAVGFAALYPLSHYLVRRVKTFKPPKVPDLLKDAYVLARRDYPILLGIYECSPTEFSEGSSALIATRCHGWKRVQWETDNEDYVAHASEYRGANIAGFVTLLRRNEEKRIGMFLLKTPALDRTVQAGLLLCALMHELGHVDDIVNAVSLREGVSVDLSAAEHYAHMFACRRIMAMAQLGDRFAKGLDKSKLDEWRSIFPDLWRPVMGAYLREMLPQLAKLDVPSIANAAQKAIASEEFETFREFAGELL